jgi:hypothetical protein
MILVLRRSSIACHSGRAAIITDRSPAKIVSVRNGPFLEVIPRGVQATVRLQSELDALCDARVQAHVQRLLVTPVLVHRHWDYWKHSLPQR